MVNFFENFREIFLHRLSGALELRKCVRPDGAAPFSAPTERGARTAAGGFALTGRLLFCTDCAGCSNCVSVFAPDGRLLSLHRLCEVLELRQRVRPDGAAPFLHRFSGALELRQRVRPNGAESFSLNLSGEWRRLRAARTLRLRAAGAQEGRQPAVFHPLVNLPFSLRGHGEICRVETRKGAAEDFSFRVFRNLFAVSDAILLHRRLSFRRRNTR